MGKGGRGRGGGLCLHAVGMRTDAGWGERADGEQCRAAVESGLPGDAAEERTGALGRLLLDETRKAGGRGQSLSPSRGVVFLPVPMIIMTRATDVHMKLAVVSVAVLWFAVSDALGSRATNQALIAATAVYTAVLVVDVGTASGVSL